MTLHELIHIKRRRREQDPHDEKKFALQIQLQGEANHQ
jgi:hypothetical protein